MPSPLDIPLNITKSVEVPEPTCLGDFVKLFHTCFLYDDMYNLCHTVGSTPDPERQYNILSPISNHGFQLQLTGQKYPVEFNYIGSSTGMETIITLVKNATKYSGMWWNITVARGLYELERRAMESR